MDGDAREKYLKAGNIASKVRDETKSMITEGALLLDVAEFAESEIVRLGGQIAFPINISIDSNAAHFTPHSNDKLRFKVGNLVKLDLGVHVDGYIADTALTEEVSTNRWQDLIIASTMALDMVIDTVKSGIKTGELGTVIEGVIESRGFLPISNLSGHAMKRYNLHAGVSVPNVSDKSVDKLTPGMVVAIEPFATNGAGRVAGRKSGNIFRQIRDRPLPNSELNALFEIIKTEFKGLPFSERNIAKHVKNSDKMLRKLLKQGAVSTYPVLKDVKGGMVSQAEHTLIVTGDGCKITTR